MHRPARPRAFTLIELLVVIAIVALLLAMMLPGLRHARVRAMETRCEANLRQMVASGHAYMSSWRTYPFGLELLDLPAGTLSCLMNRTGGPSYEMILPTPECVSSWGLKALMNANEMMPRDRQLPFANDVRPTPWHTHKQYNAVYIDGSVRAWDGVVNSGGGN